AVLSRRVWNGRRAGLVKVQVGADADVRFSLYLRYICPSHSPDYDPEVLRTDLEMRSHGPVPPPIANTDGGQNGRLNRSRKWHGDASKLPTIWHANTTWVESMQGKSDRQIPHLLSRTFPSYLLHGVRRTCPLPG